MILYRRGQLGDVVLLGSVTAALKGVTIATDPRWMPVAARLPNVVQVLPATTWKPGWIDLQGTLRSLGWARIHKRSLRRRLRLHLSWPGPRPAVPNLYAEPLGIEPQPAPWITLPPRPRRTLVLIPGASTPLKRAPLPLYQGLARRWKGPIVVLGGPGEQWDLPGQHIAESGFERTFDALERAAVAVGGDTGLLHLAGATGARVVALFGPTHPDDGFFVYPGEVLQRPLPCRPCTLHRRVDCKVQHHRCMDHWLDDVWAAVERQCAG